MEQNDTCFSVVASSSEEYKDHKVWFHANNYTGVVKVVKGSKTLQKAYQAKALFKWSRMMLVSVS